MKSFLATGAFVVFAFATTAVRAEPIRLLVAAGQERGLDSERPLRHTRDDTKRVRDVMTQLGGVAPANAIVVDGATPATLDAAIGRARAIAAAHQPDEVTLLFYFSGHGDHDAIHLGPVVVSLTEIASKIAAIPAAMKLAVVDACRTTDVVAKGVVPEPAFAISLSGAPVATGVVWLHAAADGEAAQESEELGGAIFTHYWTIGLRGAADANGDARVTLAESYDFAFNQTIYRSARSSGVVQRPAASFAIQEAEPLVLTQMSATSALHLPPGADAHYVIYALGSRSVAGELWSSPERAMSVALPSGRYVVQRLVAASGGAAEVSLGENEQRELRDSDFHSFDREALAQKGGEIVIYPNEVSVAYGAHVAALFDFGQTIEVRYARAVGPLALSVGANAGMGSQSTTADNVQLWWVGGSARVEYWRPLGTFELRAGAGPTLHYLSQRVDRNDANRVALAGYPTEQSYRALSPGFEVTAGARADIGARFSLGLDFVGSLFVASASGSLRGYSGAAALLGVGRRF